MDEKQFYQLALALLPNVGPISARNLVSYSGSLEAVFENKKRQLTQIPGIGLSIADAIVKKSSFEDAEQQLERIAKNGVKTLFYLDNDYPWRMKPIKDAPVLLFYKGNADLNAPKILGVVGTRRPSAHGKEITENIISDLKDHSLLVISGLAYGVDITAHRACVQSDIPTIGVMGSSLDIIYPSAHKKTVEKMYENGGLLSEFPFSTKPDAMNFPMRNRIIAGMCDALLVVESALKGGSMISAEIANGYDKDVFAVPGRPTDISSAGCNYLIKNHKALLVENANDLAEAMGWHHNHAERPQRTLFIEMNEEEKQITSLLSTDVDISIDKIINTLVFPPSQVASLLLQLEFKGVVKPLPGKRYVLAN
jgi:DNA processing protein